MSDRSRTGASVGLGAALGLLLATVVLPQLAGALNPTGWGTAAVATFAALIGATLQQWQSRPRGPAEDHGGEKKSWRIWFRISAGLTFAVAVATFVLYITDLHLLKKPPSIEAQIESTLKQLVEGGRRHVVVNERVTLHPSDDRSWVVVTEDASSLSAFEAETAPRQPGTKRGPVAVSDQLRIYDIENGWLTLKLLYRPIGKGTDARRWVEPAGAPAAYDFNGNGFPEIIAGYSQPDSFGSILPFLIDWTGSGYRLVAMMRSPQTLPDGHFSTAFQSDRQRWYQTKFDLPNAYKGGVAVDGIAGYQVQAFAFVATPVPRLITGVYAALPHGGEPQKLELRANQVSLANFQLVPCSYGWSYCTAPATEQVVRIPPSRFLDDGLLVGWKKDSGLWNVPIPVKSWNDTDCPGCGEAAPPAARPESGPVVAAH